MAMIKITHRQLERLILEVSSDGPVIDLKNPEFWYQDAVNPAMGKVFGWLKKNIHKKSGTLNLEETWPYPVSPEAIDEYDVGSTYYEKLWRHHFRKVIPVGIFQVAPWIGVMQMALT
jgi:hypothetical protein